MNAGPKRRHSGMSTLSRTKVPTIVAVACPERVLDLCRYASAVVGAKRLEQCDLGNLSTTAAKWRPFAIVTTPAIYDFDPSEFNALARDVGARIVQVPDEGSDDVLVDTLMRELEEAFERRRPSWS